MSLVQRETSPPSDPRLGGLRHAGGAAVDDVTALDEAIWHLALANLPADMRQQRIDELLDRRLAAMQHADA